jgi:hypothetical protein
LSILAAFKMDLEISIFHYSIPKELIELILSKFLCHKDVCRFDTAMCNIKKRRLFIEYIRSDACAWQVDINQQIKSKEMSWLNSRKIKIRSLYCNTLSRNTIAKLGHSIVWLLEVSVNSVHNIDLLVLSVAGGQNIQSFDFSSTAVNELIVMELLGHMYDMQSLNLFCAVQIDYKCMIRISEKCHNLRSLNLKGCEQITDTSIFKVAEGCPKLLSLDLGFCNSISDRGVIKIAESCLELQFLGLECLVEISDTSIL